MIRPNDTVVFYGDSITAASRDVEVVEPNTAEGLGRGYVLHIAATLLAETASPNLRIFNRGISGNRLADLRRRLRTDCLALRPTVVSILIGINDIVTCLGGEWGEPVEIDQFERDYRALLTEIRDALPGVRLLICELFYLPCGEVTEDWWPICEARRATARRLADEFSAVFVPFHHAINAARQDTDMSVWSTDGVHPTVAGQHVLARCWIESVLE